MEGITDEYVLAEHELSLLRQTVRVADQCEDLQQIVDREGVLLDRPGVPLHSTPRPRSCGCRGCSWLAW